MEIIVTSRSSLIDRAIHSARGGEPTPAPTRKSEQLHLTQRQQLILVYLAHDWPDKRIASHLQISDRQVRRDIAGLCKRLSVTGRIQLVAKSFHIGLLPFTILEPPRAD